jgi:hypothetical protein
VRHCGKEQKLNGTSIMRLISIFAVCLIALEVQAQKESIVDSAFIKMSKTTVAVSAYGLYFGAMGMNTLAADAYDTSRVADIRGVVVQSLEYFRGIRNQLDAVIPILESHQKKSEAQRIGKIRNGFELLEREAGLIVKYVDSKTQKGKQESAELYRRYNNSMMDLLDNILKNTK